MASETVCKYDRNSFKNSRKSLQNRAKRDFLQLFQEFLKLLRSYLHTVEDARMEQNSIPAKTNCLVKKTLNTVWYFLPF